MIAIASRELTQIFRNRAVLITNLVMPFAASAFFIYYRDTFAGVGSIGYVGAILVFTVAAFSLYATSVTTLAARRQSLFLKRLRTTAASDASILSGLLLPVLAIAIVQIAIVLTAFALVGTAPDNVPLLVAAVFTTFVMMAALGFATAGITNSPEHAQVTTLPLSLGVIAVASWVGIIGTAELTYLKRLLPGGAATELVVEAWNGGGSLTDSLLLLGPTLAWVVIGIVAATRMFRWEPRA